MKLLPVLFLICLQLSCTGIPQGMAPVTQFELPKYLGDWYEIARLDHSFERGLSQVTANYSMRDDGGVKVLNKGYDTETGEWQEAEGKAYFVDDKTVGHLKVSFFGPFYGSYVVFKMDQNDYQYAYVSSYNKDFLWLLSRTPQISDEIKDDFIKRAKDYGFATDEIIFVEQLKVKKGTEGFNNEQID